MKEESLLAVSKIASTWLYDCPIKQHMEKLYPI